MEEVSIEKVFKSLLSHAIKNRDIRHHSELDMDTDCMKNDYVELDYGDFSMNVTVNYSGHIVREEGGSDEHGNPELYDVWELDDVDSHIEFFIDGDKYETLLSTYYNFVTWLNEELEK